MSARECRQQALTEEPHTNKPDLAEETEPSYKLSQTMRNKKQIIITIRFYNGKHENRT